jgi:RNA-binding protein
MPNNATPNAPKKTNLRTLKRKVHHLKPVVMIGSNGLTDKVLKEIDLALTKHELIKIKISHPREVKQQMTDEICKTTGATLINSIGKIIAIYRPSDDSV